MVYKRRYSKSLLNSRQYAVFNRHNKTKIQNPKLKKMEYLRDLWAFLKKRKKFWLLPLIILLLLFGLLIVLTTGSAIAPFIYTLF